MNNIGKGKNMGQGGGRGRNKGGSFGPGGYCVCAKCGKTMIREELLERKK